MVSAEERIPVSIIGGFLGAGKTTLVNHLVRSGAHRFGIIVNEFGETSIDGSLIENVDTDGIAELANGCLCCVGREDLTSALFKLIARKDRPEYILIELSGLADPVPVAQTILDPFARSRFALDGIIAVADARHLERTLQNSPEGAVQLAYASVVVLNKTDLVSPTQRAEAEGLIQKLNPLSQIYPAVQANVAPQALLHQRASTPDWQPQPHPHRHTPHLTSFTLRAERPLERQKVNAFIDHYLIARPDAVLRAKGFLSVKGFEKQVIFQSVREIFSLELSRHPPTAPSHLVVIGRGLDAQEYQEAFQALQAL
ncbi:CobW family GTP-binding protein [Meiothermus rufus]|uniref:CobW family GTP-binding protein n=1 Tax=Meiothermus rufus TaxID=604332 RepID=UPI0004222A5C|nr:GTP-binding protein [Meiothermus rufus]